MILLLLFAHPCDSVRGPSSEIGPLQCMGGGVGGHSHLQFCLPLMYSSLTPPQGSWVVYSPDHSIVTHISYFQGPIVYVEPLVEGELSLDLMQSLITFNLHLSLFWQDTRLVTR